MTPEQCRAARAWLAWSQGKLAKAAGISLSNVKDFEAGKARPILANETAIRSVLEREGIRFSFALDNGGAYACGITFSKPSKLDS
jgi:predicted transcriptional regulator